MLSQLVQTSSSISALTLLDHFKTKLNEIGYVNHSSGLRQNFTASVSKTFLIITLDDKQRKFHYEAFNTVVENVSKKTNIPSYVIKNILAKEMGFVE